MQNRVESPWPTSGIAARMRKGNVVALREVRLLVTTVMAVGVNVLSLLLEIGLIEILILQVSKKTIVTVRLEMKEEVTEKVGDQNTDVIPAVTAMTADEETVETIEVQVGIGTMEALLGIIGAPAGIKTAVNDPTLERVTAETDNLQGRGEILLGVETVGPT